MNATNICFPIFHIKLSLPINYPNLVSVQPVDPRLLLLSPDHLHIYTVSGKKVPLYFRL